MMKADGEIIYCSRQSNPEVFKAALLNLGCLGVVINATLQCEPAFHLHEYVESATLDEVMSDASLQSQFFFIWTLIFLLLLVNTGLETKLSI